jgi:hypothetical protein
VGETRDDLQGEAAGSDVQALAGFLADLAEEFRILDDVGMDDGAGGGG